MTAAGTTWAAGSPRAASRERWVARAMDTVFSLVIPTAAQPPGVADVVAAVVEDWHAVERRLSVFRPDSEISRWRFGQVADAELSPETREVIAACDELEELTGGVFSARRAGSFDPTGYVKGWAMARTARLLDRAGIPSYCLNAGGDVIAVGHAPAGFPWRIGLAHPHRPGELATVVTAAPGDERPVAVATSGTAERGRHIAHPADGWRPNRSAISVVGHDIALADAIATAALAAGRDGPEAAGALVRKLGLEAFGFDEDCRPWWTPGLPAYALLPR